MNIVSNLGMNTNHDFLINKKQLGDPTDKAIAEQRKMKKKFK